MDIVDKIKQRAAAGGDRIVCPVCEGGNAREKCMSIWIGDGNIPHATCHRATCELTTTISLGAGVSIKVTRKDDGTDRAPVTRRLTPSEEIVLNLMYGIDPNLHGIRVSDEEEGARLALPIRTSRGICTGTTYKLWADSGKGPKALSIPYGIGASWHIPHGADRNTPAVFVEDQLSAMRLAEHGVVGVALLGAELTSKTIYDTRISFSGELYICLDSDVRHKLLKTIKKFGSRFRLRGLVIDSDIKDMAEPELEKLVNKLRSKQNVE